MNSDVRNVAIAVGGTIGIGLTLYFGYKQFYCKRQRPYIGGTVTQLHVFPVKSMAGFQLDSMVMEKFGPAFDRNWVLINAKGIFQNQSQRPKMALIRTSFDGNEYLCLDAPGMKTMKVKVDIEDDESDRLMIDILGLPVEGMYCGDEVSQWFETYLGKTGLRLYTGRNKDLKKRRLKDEPVWGDMAKEDDEAMFPNDSPVLLLSEASVATLNKKLQRPVTTLSFRPNIVVKGCKANEENSWNTIMIGDVLLRKRKQAARCGLTTVDYEIGEKRQDNEPLKTLKRDYRCRTGDKRYGDGGLFGIYFAVDTRGTVSVGDDVIVIN